MDLDLDDFVDLLNKTSDFEFDKYILDFDTAMKISYHLFGRHSFRKVYMDTEKDSPRSLINKALFVSWSVILADYDFERVKKIVKKYSFIPLLGKWITEDEYYYRALSYGTNGRWNILKAFSVAEEITKLKLIK